MAVSLQWNPKQVGMLLGGHIDGSWVVWDDEKREMWCKPQMATGAAEKSRIMDLAWDPLGGSCMLVAYACAIVVMWDVEALTELSVFERQPMGVHAIAWLHWAPGSFITVNDTTAVAKVWNVSQRAPMEHVRLAGAGVTAASVDSAWAGLPKTADSDRIHGILSIPGGASGSSASMLLSFLDGGVGIWNWRHRRLEWRSSAAHTETVFGCMFSPVDADVLATASYDGSVVIWYTPTMSILHVLHTRERDQESSPRLHQASSAAVALSDTDFGCVLYSVVWSPDGSQLAASSISGMIYIFDLTTGKVVVRLKAHSPKPCYHVDWYRFDTQGLLASTGGDGGVVIFGRDGSILERLSLPRPAYGCQWSPIAPVVSSMAFLVAGCHDACAYVFGIKAGAPPGHCAQMMLKLAGHTQRVFHTAWSPLVAGLVATGSDDGTVRVWNVASELNEAQLRQASDLPIVIKTHRTLCGHTCHVRPLAWNHEVPSLLLTGSWDASIRAWDIATGSCVCVARNHFADVYGIASHPERPFVFASCSRDSTVRFWSLGGAPSLLRLRCIVSLCMPSDAMQDHPLTAGTVTRPHVPSTAGRRDEGATEKRAATALLLSGTASQSLAKILEEGSSSGAGSVAIWSSIFNFWDGTSGIKDMWHLAGENLSEPVETPRIQGAVHCRTILDLKHEQALLLESHRMGPASPGLRGVGCWGLKKEDALLAAADIHIKCGQFEDACRLLKELDYWVHALALAPAVSHAYWIRMVNEYARKRQDSPPGMQPPNSPPGSNVLPENGALYSLVAGNVINAINSLVAREEYMDAVVIAAAHATGRFGRQEEPGKAEEDGKSDCWPQDPKSARILGVIACLIAKEKMASAQPVAAAAFLLGADRFDEAVSVLVRGHELEVAYGLACSYSAKYPKAGDAAISILPLLASRARYFGDRKLAAQLMQKAQSKLPNHHERLGSLLCVDAELYCASLASDPLCSEGEAEDIYAISGLPFGSQAEQRWVVDAQRAWAAEDSDKWRAARLYILARRHDEAADVLIGPGGALMELAEEWTTWSSTPFSEDFQRLPEPPRAVFTAVALLHSIEPKRLSCQSVVSHLMAWACWLGGWLAECQGSQWIRGLNLASMAAPLYRICRKSSNHLPALSPYLPSFKLTLAEAAALLRTCSDDSSTTRRVEGLLRQVVDGNAGSTERINAQEDMEYKHAVESATAALQRLSKWRSEDAATRVDVSKMLPGRIVEGRVVPVGSNSLCPICNDTFVASTTKDILDGRAITGGAHVLEDGSSHMRLGDAVMWSYLNPFSPLCTGERVFPVIN
jgi:WD40 repeat protein